MGYALRFPGGGCVLCDRGFPLRLRMRSASSSRVAGLSFFTFSAVPPQGWHICRAL